MAKSKPAQTVQSSLSEATDKFETVINAQGYSAHTIEQYARSARKLVTQLESSGLAIIQLDDQAAGELISQIVQRTWESGRSNIRYQLERFRDYLIAKYGAPPA